MNYDEVDEDAQAAAKRDLDVLSSKVKAQSTLDPRLKKFISLIFDMDLMQDQMVEIGYDAKKMPLGKLSANNIQKGRDILKEIEKLIGKTGSKKIKNCSIEQ